MLVDSDLFGGAEVYVRHLLHRLPGRFRCSLVVAAPLAPFFRREAAHLDVTMVPLARHGEFSPQLATAVAATRPDLVDLNLVDLTSNCTALEAALEAAPTVATLHSAQTGIDSVDRIRPLYRRLGHLIAASAACRTAVLNTFGLSTSRVTVVRNGVPVPPHAVPEPAVRPLRLGAVGRLTPQKGFDVLLEATATLHRRGRKLTVAVAGAGPQRAELERQARGLPVSFLGFRDDVSAFLRTLHLFCLPSRWEALPLAALEAMVAGLPCVLTDVGDIAEAVGAAAVVVPPEDPVALTDALEALLLDPRARRTLRHRARSRAVACFDADRMAAQTAALLRSVGPALPTLSVRG